MPGLDQRDYERLLAFRTGLRRFLYWSGQQAEAAGITLELAPRAGSTLTDDDLMVAERIQRLVGDHHHPVGRAAPWSPSDRLTGIRQRPVGPAGP